MRNMKEVLKELQDKIGYSFNNEDLLKQAITHSSFANEQIINKLNQERRKQTANTEKNQVIRSVFYCI